MPISKKDALQRAMALCSRSEKSAHDINDSLLRWGLLSEEDRSAIIRSLIENNFINENRYSRAYVKDKHLFNKWGKIKIKSMLRAKSIDSETINTALETINSEKYYSTLKEEILKKQGSVKASDQYELRSKLMRFASSKGYESDLIFRALDEILD